MKEKNVGNWKYQFPNNAEEAQEVWRKFDSRYPSDQEIIDKIEEAKQSKIDSYDAIINEIVLWKLNRQVEIEKDLIEEIKDLTKLFPSPFLRQHFKEESNEWKRIREVLLKLLDKTETTGVKIAMASTILKMFYPEVFPIIDRRAYHCMSVYKGKTKDLELKEHWKAETCIEVYRNYINDCYDYFVNVMEGEGAFKQVDQVLYQIDKNAGHPLG